MPVRFRPWAPIHILQFNDLFKMMDKFNLIIDPLLNKDAILQFSPPKELQLTDFEKLQLNAQPIPLFIKNLDLTKHIGAHSAYREKEELAGLLKLIQLRLNGGLVKHLGKITISEEQVILEKLGEGAEACSPGFHDRVQEIILSWSQPKNILQLLHLVRESLVIKAAIKLTNGVHETNRFFTLASLHGFGVRQRNGNDLHQGLLLDEKILKALKETFEASLNPYTLVQMLSESLRSTLSDVYAGYKEKGYDYGAYSSILNRLNRLLTVDGNLLNLTMDECFIIKETVEGDILIPRIVALKWGSVNKIILTQLQEHQLLVKTCIEPNNITGLVSYLKSNPLAYKSGTDFINQFNKIIKNNRDFTEIFKRLNDELKSIVLEVCCYRIPKWISNISELERLFNYLDNKQKNSLCNLLAAKWEKIIQSSVDFKRILRCLGTEQQSFMLDVLLAVLPYITIKVEDFEEIFKFFTLEQRQVLSKALIPYLPIVFKNAFALRSFLTMLTTDEKALVYTAFSPVLADIIKSAFDCDMILECLDAEQRTNFLQTFLPHFPKIIFNSFDFLTIVRHLDDEQRGVVFIACLTTLSQVMKTLSELQEIFLCLNTDQKASLCKRIGPRLAVICNDISTFNKMLKPFADKDRTIICDQTAPFFKDLIRNAADFRKIFQCLSGEQPALVFHAILPKLSEIIQCPLDFNTTLETFKTELDAEQKMFFLEALKKEQWFRPLLKQKIEGRVSFKSFFGNASPEQLIEKDIDIEKETSVQASLAAYALLKEYEKKVLKNASAYYSKPAWNALKKRAKGFFLNEDIDKIHRKQLSLKSLMPLQSIFSKPKSEQLYPGDVLFQAKNNV
ncbi:MAG: hypothetical protein H2069_04105 [Legionella sp.]|nr:hypothetical protein [Legionella sp.]